MKMYYFVFVKLFIVSHIILSSVSASDPYEQQLAFKYKEYKTYEEVVADPSLHPSVKFFEKCYKDSILLAKKLTFESTSEVLTNLKKAHDTVEKTMPGHMKTSATSYVEEWSKKVFDSCVGSRISNHLCAAYRARVDGKIDELKDLIVPLAMLRMFHHMYYIGTEDPLKHHTSVRRKNVWETPYLQILAPEHPSALLMLGARGLKISICKPGSINRESGPITMIPSDVLNYIFTQLPLTWAMKRTIMDVSKSWNILALQGSFKDITLPPEFQTFMKVYGECYALSTTASFENIKKILSTLRSAYDQLSEGCSNKYGWQCRDELASIQKRYCTKWEKRIFDTRISQYLPKNMKEPYEKRVGAKVLGLQNLIVNLAMIRVYGGWYREPSLDCDRSTSNKLNTKKTEWWDEDYLQILAPTEVLREKILDPTIESVKKYDFIEELIRRKYIFSHQSFFKAVESQLNSDLWQKAAWICTHARYEEFRESNIVHELAENLMQKGQHGLAANFLSEILTAPLYWNDSTLYNDANTLYNDALNAFLFIQDYEGMSKVCLHALGKEVLTSPEVVIDIVNKLMSKNNYQRAQYFLAENMKSNEDLVVDDPLRAYAGYVCLMNKDYQAAASYYSQVLQRNPHFDAATHASAGYACLMIKEYAEAAYYYNAAYNKNPNLSAETRCLIGYANAKWAPGSDTQLVYLREASQHFKASIDFFGSRPMNMFSDTLEMMKTVFEKTKEADERYMNWVDWRLIYHALEYNKRQEAGLPKALRDDPNVDASQWADAGFVFLRVQNYEESVRCYERALRKNPNLDDGAVHINAGLAYANLHGAFFEASSHFQRAIDLLGSTPVDFPPDQLEIMKTVLRSTNAPQVYKDWVDQKLATVSKTRKIWNNKKGSQSY